MEEVPVSLPPSDLLCQASLSQQNHDVASMDTSQLLMAHEPDTTMLTEVVRETMISQVILPYMRVGGVD